MQNEREMFVLHSRTKGMSLRHLIFVVAFAVWVMQAAAQAQNGEVTECDRLAASDIDFQRNSEPVAFKNIDPSLAIPACTKAATESKNSSRISYQLGRSLLAGKKWMEGLKHIRLAAEAGYAAAQLALGDIYESASFGMVQDQKEAELWIEKAAKQNNPKAQFRLGQRLAQANDQTKAFGWYCRSAEEGDADAQASLGIAYLEGKAWIGAPSDPVRASEWLAKAAAQGQRMAQQNLALLQQQTRGKLNARAKGSDKCDEVIKCLESGRVCR